MTKSCFLTPARLDLLISGRLHDPETKGLSLEAARSGRKVWRLRRRLPRSGVTLKMTLGTFPAHSLADARAWARALNLRIEAGTDPRDEDRLERARASMTVARAHALYMEAVREGRSSRAKRRNKPRTVAEKLEIYSRDIAPALATKVVYDVTEADLVGLVTSKGKAAKVRANRLGAELNVFFGWASSLRGTEVGLETNPARRLADLRFPETPRARKLSLEELRWFLVALAEEEEVFRRGMLAWLLTAARFSEVIRARREEIRGSRWVIPSERVKNGTEHVIALGPWGQALMRSTGEWVFPAPRAKGPRTSGWYKARDRVHARMEELAGRSIERFTPHDFRRTVRSNTKRLKFDFDTAEAVLNHLKQGLERTYDRYDLEEEKRSWFLTWEREIAAIAARAGVAETLGVPLESLGPPPKGRPDPRCPAERDDLRFEQRPPWQRGLLEARLPRTRGSPRPIHRSSKPIRGRERQNPA